MDSASSTKSTTESTDTTSTTTTSTYSIVTSSDSRKNSTRSSTGAVVKSTFMKVNLSPPPFKEEVPIPPLVVPTSKSPTEEKKKPVKKKSDNDKRIGELQEMVQDQQTRINALEASLKDRDTLLARINQRLDYHDKEAAKTRTIFHMKDIVIERLRAEVNNLQQYTRRPCVVISGIEKRQNEKHDELKNEIEKILQKVDSGVSLDDVDKLHRNGPIRDGNQEVIVRFKTHSDKESFYKGRKKVTDQRIKIRPSLTKESKDLLNSAVRYLDKLHNEDDKLDNPPHFVMANIHGQIQLKMKKEHDGRLFFPINSMKDLVDTIVRLNHTDSDNLRFYISASEDEEDEYF